MEKNTGNLTKERFEKIRHEVYSRKINPESPMSNRHYTDKNGFKIPYEQNTHLRKAAYAMVDGTRGAIVQAARIGDIPLETLTYLSSIMDVMEQATYVDDIVVCGGISHAVLFKNIYDVELLKKIKSGEEPIPE